MQTSHAWSRASAAAGVSEIDIFPLLQTLLRSVYIQSDYSHTHIRDQYTYINTCNQYTYLDPRAAYTYIHTRSVSPPPATPDGAEARYRFLVPGFLKIASTDARVYNIFTVVTCDIKVESSCLSRALNEPLQ